MPTLQNDSERKNNWGRRGSWHWFKEVYRLHIYSHLLPSNGIYVFDESWDNLILLDACRFDTFSEMNQIKGRLEYRISRGSSSEEFLLENFANHPTRKNFPELVYVAANPYVSSLVPDKFFKIYRVWDYGWDDKLRTVPPENVAKAALEARQAHPDKRLIIHFMQPHFPFLGGRLGRETGFGGLRSAVLNDVDPFSKLLDTTIDNLLERGELDVDQVWSAYRENLRIVLSHVEKLLPELGGRTVISADHGNVFDERIGLLFPFKVSGHRKNFHVKQLVKVPWLIVSDSPSINVAPQGGASEEYSEADDKLVTDRLRKLGYV